MKNALARRESPPEWLVVAPDLRLITARIIDSRDMQTGEPQGALYGAVNWRVDPDLEPGSWHLVP